MKYFIPFLLILLAGCAKPADKVPSQIEVATFDIHRGTNISHWLSQSNRRGAEREAYFTESDVAFLSAQGFDHLRIPIDEMQMWNEAGEKEPEAFALLHNSLKCARATTSRPLSICTFSAPTILMKAKTALDAT
ncbi:MAG: hypothetical protein R3C61_01585 [Bacteroidia bacterium]